MKVSVEMTVAIGKIRVKVMMDLGQRVLGGRGIPDEWKTSVTVPISKGKGNVMSCEAYRGIKILGHAMKIVESARVINTTKEDLKEANGIGVREDWFKDGEYSELSDLGGVQRIVEA